MPKARTTLTIDWEVLRAVKLRAASTSRGDSEVIEGAPRRQLGLDLLEEMWAKAPLTEREAVELAVEAQHQSRPRRSRSGVRAVLDPNGIICDVLSPEGSPACGLAAWRVGRFEVIAFPQLIEELRRALAYPKLRSWSIEAAGARLVSWVSETAIGADDPDPHPGMVRPALATTTASRSPPTTPPRLCPGTGTSLS